MISYVAYLKLRRTIRRLQMFLVLSVTLLAWVTIYLFTQTDIKPEKLDSSGPEATTEKGDVMTNRHRWECELVRVIDGDTLQGWISLDFGVKLEARFRLEGIDTPEIHTVKQNTEEYKKGMLAKAFVEARFKVQGNKFWIETSGKRPGKYGRFVVNVLMPSGDYLGELLLKAGHAVKKEY